MMGLLTPDQWTAIGLLGNGLAKHDFSGGAVNAMQYLDEAPLKQLRIGLLNAEMQDAQAKAEERKRQRAFLDNLPDPQFQLGANTMANGQGPTVANATRIPATSPALQMLYQGARAGAVPIGDYLKSISPEPLPMDKISPEKFTPASLAKFAQTRNFGDLVPRDKLEQTEGVIWNPFDPANAGRALPNPNKPFALDATGRAVPNMPFQQYEKDKAAAGAARTSVSVNTDKSYFGNVAEGLAKNDVALIDAARSAPDRIASAQRVKQILAQNPITGTGAEARLSLNRALATAGLVDGKNVADTEMLASTLASQTLDAIKTSGLGSGQGFTDKDRQFLERARSGNIEMSAASLAQLADLNERAARASIQRGNAVIGKLRMNPLSGTMGQQLDPIAEPAPTPIVRKPAVPASASRGGVRFLGFE